MKLVFIALLALAVAVVAGHYVAEDPGFIVIGYGGTVVRTTFAFFVVALLVAFLALHGLINFLAYLGRARIRWRQRADRRRSRRAHDSLARGLMAMAAGDFNRAERLFRGGIDDDAQPEAHYLAAAAAAQAAHAPARRDNYLTLAAEARPESQHVFLLKRAEWLVENGQLTEARPLVDKLARAESGNPQVLRLRMIIARDTHDHEGLLTLLPDLRRDHVLAHDEANVMERASVAAVLGQTDLSLEALRSRWRALSKHLRAEPEVLSAYVRALCRLGADDQAEELVRKRLERRWDSSLAALYGEIRCEPPARQLRKLEAWAVTRADDPGLRLARARQAIRAGLWGQAGTHVEYLMGHAPSPLLLELRAEIAEATGDEASAAAHRRAGLALAIGASPRAALPPPGDD
ncbi:MAG: heme biosynthesis HemY N-terminal domain-containing protein [Gammaproteobacteria bacterium]